MSTDPIKSAAATESGLVQLTLLDALVKRNPYVLGAGENLGGLDQTAGGSSQKHLCVISVDTGYLYTYDSTDTTTADDGITCLVDANGNRYKIGDASALALSSVLAMQNTPPGSPSVGDAYIVDTAPTGDWAGHAKDVALYSARGWVFASPVIGLGLLNQATDANLQYDDTGAWNGFPFSAAATSIKNHLLKFGLNGLPVEAAQTTPPGSPTEGLYYRVTATATGDWAGQEDKVAYYESAAWAFISPYEGARIYNRDTGEFETYASGSWTTASAALTYQEFSTTGIWNKPSSGTIAIVEVIGGGGSGGKSGSGGTSSGGGGGGHVLTAILKMSALSSTETVTVGAGGASKTTTGSGNDGQASSFGGHLVSKGGAKGNQSSIGQGSYAGTATAITKASLHTWLAETDAANGGDYVSPSGASGDTSLAFGDGGDGSSSAATAGSAPGGGGGGSGNGNSGAGGAGRIRVTVI